MKKVLGLILVLSVLSSVSVFASNNAEANDNKQITIGLSVDQLFESRIATNNGVKAEAEKNGFKIIEVVADGDAQTQNSQIQTLIAQKVDAILVCAVDQNTIETALMKAKKAGIIVISYDRALPGSKSISASSAPDSISDGANCGEYVAGKVKGMGNVVILELLGALNDQNGIDRSKGFNDALAGLDNVEIIAMPTDWASDKALAATQNAFQSNPEIVAIFAATDTQIPSIETVLTDMGKLKNIDEDGHVIVVGINGSFDGYESVKNGTADGISVMDCDTIGRTAVKLAIKAMNGEATQNVVVPGNFFTIENIEANKANIWGAK